MNNAIVWPTHRRKARAQKNARVRKQPVTKPRRYWGKDDEQ